MGLDSQNKALLRLVLRYSSSVNTEGRGCPYVIVAATFSSSPVTFCRRPCSLFYEWILIIQRASRPLLNSNMADTRPMSYLRGCNPSKNCSQRTNVAKKRNGLRGTVGRTTAVNVPLISRPLIINDCIRYSDKLRSF